MQHPKKNEHKMAAVLAADLSRVASEAAGAVVTVSELSGACHEVAIASEADTGDSLADKVRAAMALSKSTPVELYLSSDGTPIEAGVALAAQGVGDGAALDVVVSNPKAALADENIKDAVKRWFDLETRQAVVEEFGEIGDWEVGAVTNMRSLFYNRREFNEDLSRWHTSSVETMQSMFEGASSFNQPVEAWDTSRVEDMRSMFEDASSFDQPVEAWDTSRVEWMNSMFDDADSFNHYPTWLR